MSETRLDRTTQLLLNYVGGRFVPPKGGEFLSDYSPATGAVIAEVPRSGRLDVEQAVEAARKAFEQFGRRSSDAERADLCDAIAAGIEERSEELAELESLDTGKPIGVARSVDIPRAVQNFRFFAGAVRHQELSCHPMAGALNYTLRRPMGVAGLITPWNLPLYLLTWKAAPALAMGNAVVAKPSELTPLTAHALAEIVDEVGAPAGLFNVVHGLGFEAGEAIVAHPDVPLISFTGGTATGRKVAALAAPLFKKMSLELGGKNPTLVFGDADFEASVEGAVRAGFLNQGQVCLCGSRILVEKNVYQPFVEALVRSVEQMAVGDPADPKTQLGALISAAHKAKVRQYLELAIEEGGTIACGGGTPPLPGRLQGGYYLEPTVVLGLAPNCRTATEEIFGPVVSVHPFKDEKEAVQLANGVRYGLSASIWTRDLDRAHRVSAALDTGMVWVNTWLLRDLRVPFGGMKESGIGREGGRYSLEFFSESRNVCIKVAPAPADSKETRT